MSADTQNVAFLGLGVMGGYMAANLSKAGFNVKAWNRTPNRPGVETASSAGCTIMRSIAEAVKDVSVIFTCVGDVPDVREVILGDGGCTAHAKANTVIVDTTTIGPLAAASVSEELKGKGFRFMDAPLTGGDVGAKGGTLTIMVGGSESDFNECLPYFKAMGKNIKLCGEVGKGQAVKLCNQVLCGVHMVGLCEALLLAEKQGLDPNLIVEVCSSGAAGSWALSNLGPKIIEKDFKPGFMIKHILKDLRFVHEVAGEVDQPLPGASLANQLFEEVLNAGGGDDGTQAMMKGYKETS